MMTWPFLAFFLVVQVTLAAEVDLSSDISRDGNCKAEAAKLCTDHKVTVFNCFQEAMAAARLAHQEVPFSKLCTKTYRQMFLAKMRSPDAGIMRQCTEDLARNHCNDQPTTEKQVSCLRRVDPKSLQPACKDKLFLISESRSANVYLDQDLFQACGKELTNDGPCPRVAGIPGHQVACLRGRRDKLPENCQKELFQRDVLDAEDVRLNKKVFSACEKELKSRCKDAEVGQARKLLCLWRESFVQHTVAEEFTHRCRVHVTNLTRQSLQDYRLDFRIRQRCDRDIQKNCKAEKARVDKLTITELFMSTTRDGQTFQPQAGQVITCLKEQLKKKNITSTQCQSEVSRAVAVESASFGTDPEVLRQCRNDMTKFCVGVPTSKVHMCLRKHIAKVDSLCKAKVTTHAVLEGEDITRNPVLAGLCKPAISQFCHGVQPGQARVMNCLQDNRHHADFPAECKKGVVEHLESVNADWRLKYGISSECERDVGRLCSNRSDVLKCLKLNMEEVQRQGCKTELRRYVKQGVMNIRLAPVAFKACKNDTETFCKDVEPGEHRVHNCLWEHRLDLGSACAKEEFEQLRMISINAALDKRVHTRCAPTVKKFCGTVAENALWDCLRDHRSDPSVSSQCQMLVQSHVELTHRDIFLNPKLVDFCAKDAQSLCQRELDDDLDGVTREGEIISCLLESRQLIEDVRCQGALKRFAKERVGNINLHAGNVMACKSDIVKFCPDLRSTGKGEIYNCLEHNFRNLQNACRNVVKENWELQADDIDFKPKLLSVCEKTVDKFCKHTVSGFLSQTGGKISCLLNNLHHKEMDSDCEVALVEEQNWRSKALGRNPGLKNHCQGDLMELLSKGKCGHANQEGWKLECLRNNSQSLKKDDCKRGVQKYAARLSADIRVSSVVKNMCDDDLKTLCPDVTLGKARGHECLAKQVSLVKNEACKAFVKGHIVQNSTSASLNFQVHQACQTERDQFCKTIQAADGHLLKCLALHRSQLSFGEACKNALLHTVAKNITVGSNTAEESFVHRHFVIFMALLIGFVIAMGLMVSHALMNKTLLVDQYQVAPSVVGRGHEG